MQQAQIVGRIRTVSQFMTPDPICAQLTSTVREVADIFAGADIRHLPIVDNGQLVALVSDRDMRVVTSWYLSLPAENTSRPYLTVADICDEEVFSVSPDDDIVDAIDLMLNHKIGALPVVDPQSRKVVGIVSYIDILRELRDAIA